MIDKALHCIAAELDRHLRQRRESGLEEVKLISLVDSAGAMAQQAEECVALLLAGIDEEKNIQDTPGAAVALPLGLRLTKPIFLNLHVVFAATHRHYETALSSLTAVIEYLKFKSRFDQKNTPNLPEPIRHLGFNLEKLSYAETNNLWGYLGTHYRPSVNYTIRAVAAGEGRPDQWASVVVRPATATSSSS